MRRRHLNIGAEIVFRILLVTVLVFNLMSGCAVDDREKLKIVGHVIPVPTRNDKKLDAKILDSQPSGNRIIMAQTALETGHPYLVDHAMFFTALWVGEQNDRKDLFLPLIESCLANKDPFTRMAGLRAADIIEERARVRLELTKDSSFLLHRPDYEQLSLWKTRENTPRCLTAISIAVCRARILELVGELNVQSAAPVLKSIVMDEHEWHDLTREAARQSLKILESKRQNPLKVVSFSNI